MRKVVFKTLPSQIPIQKVKRDGGQKETAYLNSSKANRKHLEASIEEARKGTVRSFNANNFDLNDLLNIR